MSWLHDAWLRVYWYFHGPVSHAQPHQRGFVNMSGESIVRFLMTEVVLALVMLFCVWGIKKLGWEAEPSKLATYLVYVLFGGAMIIVLFRFLGVF